MIRLSNYVMLEIELKLELNLLVRKVRSFEEQHLSEVGGEESEPSRTSEGLGSEFWRESSPILALRSLIGRPLGRRVAQASSGINRDEVSTRRFPSRLCDFTREEETTEKQSK